MERRENNKQKEEKGVRKLTIEDIEEYRNINGSRTIYSFVNSNLKVAISRIT